MEIETKRNIGTKKKPKALKVKIKDEEDENKKE